MSRDLPAVANWIMRRIQWLPSYGSRNFVVATTLDTKVSLIAIELYASKLILEPSH